MSNWLYVILGILLLICIILILKIYSIKKSIKEIQKSIENILNTDTNNLILISDASVKKLAIFLNKELKEMRKQKLQYEYGNQELKRNITNVSHDLRTPLTAIKGYIELLKEESLTQNSRKYISVINRKTEELTELTEQLFDFAKILDTDMVLTKEKCYLNELLEEVLASYYPIFKEKDIVPEVLICKEKVEKELNKASMIRVFENIFSNVVKYSNGNFKVELKNDGEIIFSNKATSLDATTVQKIFDRYFSVENAKESTGIGLSIAKQLVELNGGSISADYVKNVLVIEVRLC